MAKKVILKDLNDIEVLPITRGELVLDASGNPALHSTLFLATDSLPGLMSSEDKYKLDHLEDSGPGANNKVAQINTTTDDVYRLLFSETADDTDRTEKSRKSANLTFNPSTGVLDLTGTINAHGGTFNGNVTASSIFPLNNTFQLGSSSSRWGNVHSEYGTFYSGLTVNGSNVWTAATFNPSNYVPLTGGVVMTGSLSIKTSGTIFTIRSSNGGTPYINFRSDIDGTNTDLGDLGVDTNKNLVYYKGGWKKVWHEGNLKNLSDLNDDIVNGKYLPLSGGVLSGDISFGADGITQNNTGTSTRLPSHIYRNVYDTSGNVYDHYFNQRYTASTNTFANLRVKTSGGMKVLRFGGDGTFTWDGNNILHSGNYHLYALPITGGSIKSSGVGLRIKRTGGNPKIAFYIDEKLKGYIGYDDNENPIVHPASGSEQIIIHSGNIGNQSVGNASTADKLKNKVKIWGLDFDGSSDVSGYVKGNYFTIGDRNNAYIELLSGTYYGYIQMLSDGSIAMGPNASKSIIVDQNGNVSIGGSTTILSALSVTGTGTFNNQIISNVADGTAPLTVISTTKVSNLNADLLDGYDSADIMHVGTWNTADNQSGNVIIPFLGKANPINSSEHIYGSVLQWTAYLNSTPGVSNNSWYYLLWGVTSYDRLYFRKRTNTGSWSTAQALAFISDIPTITDYYWANVLISKISNDKTTPTFANTTVNGIVTVNGPQNALTINSSGKSAYTLFIKMINPNMSTTYHTSLLAFGYDQTAYNVGYIGFKFVAKDSKSNMVTLGLHSVDHVLNITGNGFVGIGTEAPTRALDVNGTIRTRHANNKDILLERATGNLDGAGIAFWNPTSSWHLGTINAKTLIINTETSGNVGIGTTNPGYKLEVNGTAASRSFRILNNSSAKDSWLHFSPYDSDATTSFGISGSYSNLGLTIYNYHVGASSLTIGKNSNNVGIGTTSPAYKLEVNGTISSPLFYYDVRSASTKPIIYIGANNVDATLLRVYSSDTSDPANYAGRYGFSVKYLGTGSDDTNAFVLYADNKSSTTQNVAIGVDLRGYVGIGTTSPYAPLSVNGEIYTNPYIRFVDNRRYCGYYANGKYLELYNGVGGVGIHLYDDGNAYVYKSGSKHTILDSGNSSVSGGGSSWGSSITVKINGTSQTLTIPANPNTDSYVNQSETTTSNYRPIVFGYVGSSTAGSSMTTNVTSVVYTSNKFYAQPSSGNLYATQFNGKLSVPGGLYYNDSNYGIHMNNSDIVGANGIYFADHVDGATEGINFYRSATTWDTLFATNGVVYFSPNRASTTYTTTPLFSALSNSGNNISITIGGYNRTLTPAYATSAGNADTVDNKHASDFMPASGAYISGTTVADVKTNLLNYFKGKPATTSAYTSSTFVVNFGNNSYKIESSSVCGWIALNPGYDNYNHGHFLVSEYGNNRLRHVGLGYNTWYGPYTIAYTSDIPTKTSQLTNDSGFITGSYYPLAGNTNMSGDNKWIGSTMGGGTDYWRIGGSGTGDNGVCLITIGNNSNDYFQIVIADYSGTNYTALLVKNGGTYAPHFYESSDQRLKTNIQEILNKENIPQIKEFDWKESGEHSYGLIAQELEEQGYSELVSTKDDGYKTVNYSAALSLIVGKLQVKIKELEKEIEILKNKN